MAPAKSATEGRLGRLVRRWALEAAGVVQCSNGWRSRRECFPVQRWVFQAAGVVQCRNEYWGQRGWFDAAMSVLGRGAAGVVQCSNEYRGQEG
eukprot:365467-Chlamydomonas_euryale.AAC.4